MGIYWVLSVDCSCTETILLGLPRKSGGLVPYLITSAYTEKVDFIESTISDDFIYHHSGIYHRALIEGNLLDDLCECDELEYKRFLNFLKEEGQIYFGFY